MALMIDNTKQCFLCNTTFSTESSTPMCREVGVCPTCFEQNVDMLSTHERKHIKPYIKPNQVIGNLYIGSDNSAVNERALKEAGFTHILVAGSHLTCRFPDSFTYKQLIIDDSLVEDILKVMEDSIDFITSALEAGGKVLVHCASGISRSASICIGYLIKNTELDTFEKAYLFLRDKRPQIHPNSNFVKQLKIYENTNRQARPKAQLPSTK